MKVVPRIYALRTKAVRRAFFLALANVCSGRNEAHEVHGFAESHGTAL